MRAGPDSPFPRRLSISDAIPDLIQRGPKRPKHKCVNGATKVAYRFRTLRRSKRVRTKLIRRRVSKRVNQWTERETRYDIKTKSWSVNGWCHFLILELDQPFGGLIRISSEPMLNALHQLAK